MVLKRIFVVGLCAMLFVSLLGANAAIALDRGALNADYAKQTATEEGLYDAVHEEALDTITQDVPESDELPGDLDVRGVVTDALTREYIRDQSEANIDRVYAFLHGDDDLEVVVETEALKENVIDALVDEVKQMDVSELAGDEGAAGRLSNLSESEESYEAEREAFRDELKAEIVAQTGIDPDDDFGSERLAALAESEESYEAERDAFEEDRKQEIQEETDRELSDEELEQAYRDNLPEIRDQLRSQLEDSYLNDDTPEPLEAPITDLIDLTVEAYTTDMAYDEFASEYEAIKESFDDNLDRLIEDRGDEYADEIKAEIEAGMAGADLPEPFEDGMRATVDLVFEAYTTDMTYDEFTSELESIKVTMAEEGGNFILNDPENGVPDRIELTEDMDESDRESLEPVQQAVSVVDLLALLLPLLSLGMVGGIYGITRREDTVALSVGVVAVIAGALSAGVARIVPAEVFDLIDADLQDALVESMEGMVWALFDPLWVQSLVLVVAGVGLAVLGVALRYELGPFDRTDD